MPKKLTLEQKWWKAIRENNLEGIKTLCYNTCKKKGKWASDPGLGKYRDMNVRAHFANLQDEARGNSALHLAGYRGNVNLAELLMAYGANPDLWNRDKETPLIATLKQKRANVALFLLQQGANPNCVCIRAHTPLHYIVLIGDSAIDLTKLIIEKCPGILNYQSDVGKTALHLAAENGHLQTTQLLLLQEELDLLARDELGRTAVDLAMGDVAKTIDREMRKRKRRTAAGDTNMVDDAFTIKPSVATSNEPEVELDHTPLFEGIESEFAANAKSDDPIKRPNGVPYEDVTTDKKESFYDILTVSRDATESDIKKSYRRLALKYHPDKNIGDAAAAARHMFACVSEAYNTLIDTKLRLAYDEGGTEKLAEVREDEMMAPRWKEAEDVMADFDELNDCFNSIASLNDETESTTSDSDADSATMAPDVLSQLTSSQQLALNKALYPAKSGLVASDTSECTSKDEVLAITLPSAVETTAQLDMQVDLVTKAPVDTVAAVTPGYGSADVQQSSQATLPKSHVASTNVNSVSPNTPHRSKVENVTSHDVRTTQTTSVLERKRNVKNVSVGECKEEIHRAATAPAWTNAYDTAEQANTEHVDFTDMLADLEDEFRTLQAQQGTLEKAQSYYEIMGLTKHFTPTELKKNYRKLAMTYHPDKNIGRDAVGAAKMFALVAEAYQTLSDARLRAAYDVGGTASVLDAKEQDINNPKWKEAEDVLADFDSLAGHFKDLENSEMDEMETTLKRVSSVMSQTTDYASESSHEADPPTARVLTGKLKPKGPLGRMKMYDERGQAPHSAPVRRKKNVFDFNVILSDF